MAFRKKADLVLALKPDILIVPECEHPDKITFSNEASEPTNFLWFGTNPNKGLGVLTYGDYQLEQLECYDPKLRTIVPLVVSTGLDRFTLFAIWASNPDDPDGHHIVQVWKAIHAYDAILTKAKTLLVGDFNSNTNLDRKHREGNHSNVVRFLEEKEIYSAYHSHFQQQQGSEEHSTLFMYRHLDKPYHIDYCFASADFMRKLTNVQVGTFADWSMYSDHSPLIVDFSI